MTTMTTNGRGLTGKPVKPALQVVQVRGWRDIARDVFYDTALAVLWLATLWLLIMDVVAS